MPRWHVTPLPTYDEKRKFIKAQDLEVSLRGSLILVYFKLRHYAIRDKRMSHINTNIFSAMATQVKVLVHGPGQNPSPYRSLMLKGPRTFPQLPSKKKDQINAIRAFHPAATATKSNVESEGQSVKCRGEKKGKRGQQGHNHNRGWSLSPWKPGKEKEKTEQVVHWYPQRIRPMLILFFFSIIRSFKIEMASSHLYQMMRPSSSTHSDLMWI